MILMMLRPWWRFKLNESYTITIPYLLNKMGLQIEATSNSKQHIRFLAEYWKLSNRLGRTPFFTNLKNATPAKENYTFFFTLVL